MCISEGKNVSWCRWFQCVEGAWGEKQADCMWPMLTVPVIEGPTCTHFVQLFEQRINSTDLKEHSWDCVIPSWVPKVWIYGPVQLWKRKFRWGLVITCSPVWCFWVQLPNGICRLYWLAFNFLPKRQGLLAGLSEHSLWEVLGQWVEWLESGNCGEVLSGFWVLGLGCK